MESVLTWVQVLLTAVSLVLVYGSSSDRKRSQFKKWLADAASATKPHLAKLLLRIACTGTTAVAGWICWESAEAVHAFSTSLEPMTRADVFHLLLNSFNAITYAVFTGIAAAVTIKPPRLPEENGKLAISIKENESFSLCVAENADIEKLIEALKQGDARFHVTSVSRGRAKLLIDAPKDLRIIRKEHPEKAETV